METTATAKNVLVGFDKLQNYLEKKPGSFDTIKIANTHNDKTNFRVEFNSKGAENIPLLMDYLQEWAPEVPYTWWICLYKGKQQVERFPFSKLNPLPQQATAVGGIPPEMVQQLVEAEKKAAILEFQLNELAKEALEDEDEYEEDEQNQLLGAVIQQVQPHIPALIEGLMNILTAKRQPLQVAGVNEPLAPEVLECVSILMAHGVTLAHLQKLVKKAQDGSLKPLLMML